MNTKSLVILIVSIAITGLLIAFLSPIAIGNLEDAVSDAENFEEAAITEYTANNIQLNDTDTYNFTTLHHADGDKINATFEYTNVTGTPTGTWKVNASQEKQTSLNNNTWHTLNFTVSDADIDYVIYDVYVQEIGPGSTQDYIVADFNQTVHTTQSYNQSTLDIFSLMPLMIALVILMGLVAYVIKVI